MLSNAKVKTLMANAPREPVLVETDGPFAKIQGRASRPKDIAIVYRALAGHWSIGFEETVEFVTKNFNRITERADCAACATFFLGRRGGKP